MNHSKKFASVLSSLIFISLMLGSCSFFEHDELINGSQSPDISLADRNGQNISLSSFRGKLVLVEFWASWCKPCREKNPKVVELYDKFKGASFQKADGFVIYSVSLDSEKEKWQEAIKKDKLHWEPQVSDLKGWKSPAADSFRVNSIPSSYLIDQNGIIIGKNLKPQELDRLLTLLLAETEQ